MLRARMAPRLRVLEERAEEAAIEQGSVLDLICLRSDVEPPVGAKFKIYNEIMKGNEVHVWHLILWYLGHHGR